MSTLDKPGIRILLGTTLNCPKKTRKPTPKQLVKTCTFALQTGTARILSALHQAGINLLGVSAFPHGARRSQLDFIPEDSAAFAKAVQSSGLLTLSKKKSGFLIQGDDRPGAIAEITSKLADAKVNITSVQAFCAGSGRYGGMLWVKAADLRKAAKVLGVGEAH